jgi:hypothetical protein
MSRDEVSARRLDRHGLAEPVAAERLVEQVGVMCGAHAQILSAAELSIGLRVADITRADVRDVLWNKRELVKTYGPRGTVHLLPTHDLPIWIGALSALAALPSSRTINPNDMILTPEQTDEVVEAIGIALEDAELTADDLGAVVIPRLGAWAGEEVLQGFQSTLPRWRWGIGAAAIRGALCFAPNQGRRVAYTHPRRLLPNFEPADGPPAVVEVLRRYLYAYGPATPEQFARWLSAPQGWAKALFDSLPDELEQVAFDGTLAWVAAGDTKVPSEAPQGVRLLPYFDVYGVGCYPREKLFPARAAERALAHGQAGNFPVLLINGIVAGVWHQRRSGKKIEITVEPLQPLTASQQRELEEQAARVGDFLEGTPRLTIGPVTVGAHA